MCDTPLVKDHQPKEAAVFDLGRNRYAGGNHIPQTINPHHGRKGHIDNPNATESFNPDSFKRAVDVGFSHKGRYHQFGGSEGEAPERFFVGKHPGVLYPKNNPDFGTAKALAEHFGMKHNKGFSAGMGAAYSYFTPAKATREGMRKQGGYQRGKKGGLFKKSKQGKKIYKKR